MVSFCLNLANTAHADMDLFYTVSSNSHDPKSITSLVKMKSGPSYSGTQRLPTCTDMKLYCFFKVKWSCDVDIISVCQISLKFQLQKSNVLPKWGGHNPYWHGVIPFLFCKTLCNDGVINVCPFQWLPFSKFTDHSSHGYIDISSSPSWASNIKQIEAN